MSIGNKVSLINVDFPLPETPVTHTRQLSGKFTLTSFRLLPEAFLIFMVFFNDIFLEVLFICLCAKYLPVNELLELSFSGLFLATISPPSFPAPGPISMIRSASFIISLSCSTTKIEFPLSLRFFNEAINL